MAKPKRKKRRKGGAGGKRSSTEGPKKSPPQDEYSGGGVMQGIRSGFRRAAGAESAPTEESPLSKALWTIAMIAAAAFLAYRCYG